MAVQDLKGLPLLWREPLQPNKEIPRLSCGMLAECVECSSQLQGDQLDKEHIMKGTVSIRYMGVVEGDDISDQTDERNRASKEPQKAHMTENQL